MIVIKSFKSLNSRIIDCTFMFSH